LENQQLNNLVVKYQADQSDDTFTEIYRWAIGDIHKMSVTIGKSISASSEEVIAIYEDTLMKCVERFDGRGNFQNYFNASVVRERAKILRNKRTSARYETLLPKKSNDESSEATFDISDDFDLEQTVVQTKKADQRQLISFLLKDSDATTKAIVEAYMTLPKANPLAVEKATGICRKKVSRRLEKLASKFDTKQFGEYQDYLVAL
jgi:hypothetical protein